MNNMHKIDINLKKRIIKHPKFSNNINLDITDTIMAYNDGKVWKIIPLDVLLRYPIIYDKYYDRTNTKKGRYIISDITITYCPFSGCGIVYFGKFVPTNKVYNNNIVLTDKNNNMLVQMTGAPVAGFNNKQLKPIEYEFLRREEAKIFILRNAISKYPDCLFLIHSTNIEPIVEHNYTKNKKIMYPLKYTSAKYHPKTLVYGIEYKSYYVENLKFSSKNIENDNKYSVIVSDDASKDKINSRNYNKTKYNIYFSKMMDKIRDRSGIIIPAYWFAWYNMFPNTKVIKL